MYLGLDLGTSGIKALLIDDAQNIIGSTHAALTVSRPHTGWSQQDPADWITQANSAITQLRAEFPKPFSAIRAIGLSGQMHGATVLDASGKPLAPAILWNDTRSAHHAAALDADPQFRTLTGNIVFPGFTAPKLAWMRDKMPDVFAKIAKVLLPKDYLRYWLTGAYVSDMSDASGTSWLDVGARAWSVDLLAATDMDIDQMPDLVEGSDVSAHLRDDLARAWGLGARVVVAGGAGDNAASAIGLGHVQSGAAFVSLGTSGVLFAPTDAFLPKPETAVHAFCHAVPNTWHQMGVILAAADALGWWAGINKCTVADLMSELDPNLPRPSKVQFLPYLSGERTPHNDANLRGSFQGMGISDTRADLTRAVLEGVAFALRDNQQALAATGTRIAQIMAVGGGTKSAIWLDIMASVLNCPIDLPKEGDFGAALGAARLGIMADTGADPAKVCTPPAIAKQFTPRADLVAEYCEKHHAFGRLIKA